jgi:hypothetical protein
MELRNFENRVLIHSESEDSVIVPMWEDCHAENVLTVREVVDLLKEEGDPIDYHRVPLTAEQTPDESDYDSLIHILSSINLTNTAIVL